jgi:hypothetical protein
MTEAFLPYVEHAVVPERKVIAYLLSEAHPDGRGKARFFSSYGFTNADWRTLATGLRLHAEKNQVAEMVQTPFGVRYIVKGPLHTPDGRTPDVCVVSSICTALYPGSSPPIQSSGENRYDQGDGSCGSDEGH